MEKKKSNGHTTIWLSREVKETLDMCGYKGETYNQILIKLIKLFSKGEGRLEKQARECLSKYNL